MGLLSLATSLLAVSSTATAASLAQRNGNNKLTTAAQSLFDYSMEVSDSRFDSSYGYIWYQDNGQWSVRFTAWYIAGLLHRGKADDVKAAVMAIENVLANQLNSDFDSAWYGTFKLAPDEPDPTPNGTLYPPSIYGTYDPNWREFVGTQLIQVVEEFGHLLPKGLESRIEDALEAAAIGGMRRNGSFPQDDNLILGYSNPGIMRTLTTGWVGKRKNNKELINFAKEQGEDIYKLFKRDQNALAEYNAPNYYGIDIWALAANIAYGPKEDPMTKNAKLILEKLWDDIADHYNPYLGNMVGPYDRAYSRDANTHSQILSMILWGLYGRGVGGQPPLGEGDLLYDVAQGAAIAMVLDVVAPTVSKKAQSIIKSKGKWKGERFVKKTIYEDLESKNARHVTSWLSAELMIGGQSVAEEKNRGNQYVPAIVQWASDPKHKPYPYMGFFSLYPSASTLTAVAGPKSLTVSYPNTTQEGTDIFTFALTGIPPSWTLGSKNVVKGLEKLPCLDVNVTAPGLVKQDVVYGATLRDHWIYNVSYVVPEGFKGVPKVTLDMEYTC
ncbi:unnamed protein product [Fusarium graminearum]|uniref:Linalool dehydratase/isomerase domain-containing protein n=1 Tax=Gibberella zeae TaxID=5518 RepID=A0A4E9EG79_GIBZA|nr:hypothetical protein FG05_07691 [Fusarium graminearum]CAF3574667.1 unnamed protein product [Fusarium graminearum]CAG1970476.1 unnamed protein product [Fusarium graminearum]CAG1980478.1 unnamed protein product [Fusarium graminearum]CAG1982492.1 unnamed protein product [Fusarium graminearum]